MKSLRRAHPTAPLVVFCRADCWMSWNAAKRLRAWGFGDVRWYPAGSDGWAEMGRPLVAVRPYGEGKN
ncbi:hypothetical protein [Sphingomonas ginkgonis]|uniref:hypothetical protein n=1 Tax=Sphingomonas ginkgonis TaxID=2315330 RepID=UPI000F86BFC5|nr:hypothetical protein [Sphingomonas ginkgonis]